jgi:hypothetical protein
MRKTVAILLMLGRLLGVLQILGGVAIWIAMPPWLLQAHMAIGSLFVLVLWVVGVIGLFALSKRGFALFTLLWGALVLWLGMAQISLLPGPTHWVIRVLHLLIGLAAIGLLERLGKALKAHWNGAPEPR